MSLHPPTILIANLIVNAIAEVAFAIIWWRARNRYQGLALLLLNLLCQILGMMLIVGRPMTGEVFGYVAGNALLLGSLIPLLAGLRRFRGLDDRRAWIAAGWVGLYAVVASASLIEGFGKSVPEATQALLIIVLEGQILHAIWSAAPAGPLPARTFLTVGVLGYILISAVRMVFFVKMAFGAAAQVPAWVDGLTAIGYTCGTIWMVVGLVLVVTQQLVDDIARQEKTYRKAYEAAPYALILSDLPTGRIQLVNRAFELMFGSPRSQAVGNVLSALGPWKYSENDTSVRLALEGGQPVKRCEVALRHDDGRTLVGLLSSETVELPKGKRMLTTIADVTELARARQVLKELATHDVLTNLPNRLLLQDRLDNSIARAMRGQNIFALISMDLDKFKSVNDDHGHAAGDAVLVAVARRLETCLRSCDTVARLGGDEFVIVLDNLADRSAVEIVAEKVVTAIREPISCNGVTFTVSASLGVALYPFHGDDPTSLFKASDQALYQTKARGRDGWTIASQAGSASREEAGRPE